MEKKEQGQIMLSLTREMFGRILVHENINIGRESRTTSLPFTLESTVCPVRLREEAFSYSIDLFVFLIFMNGIIFPPPIERPGQRTSIDHEKNDGVKENKHKPFDALTRYISRVD